MDQVKKNLHFIVFGAGVLLGIILLVVGIMIKSGAQDRLAAAGKLPDPKNQPTKKDLANAKDKRAAFDKEIKTVESALASGAGVALKSNHTSHADGSSFYSAEADSMLKNLRTRFEAMEAESTLPAELGGRKLAAPQSPPKFWDETFRVMNSITDPKQIINFQIQLRIMQEVCFTCEQLRKQKAFEKTGVKLVEFKFEFRATEGLAADTPWEDYPFTVFLDTQPGFLAALADELSNPSEATMGDKAKPGNAELAKAGKGRWLFPVEIEVVQSELVDRPLLVNADITNAEKAKYGIAETLKESDPNFEVKRRELSEKWSKDLKLTLPVHGAIKAKALSYNKSWAGVVEPASSN